MKRRTGFICMVAALFAALLLVPQVALADEPSIETAISSDSSSIAFEVCPEQEAESSADDEIAITDEMGQALEEGLPAGDADAPALSLEESVSEDEELSTGDESSDVQVRVGASDEEQAEGAAPVLRLADVKQENKAAELAVQSGGEIPDGAYVIKVTTTYGSALSTSGNRNAGAVKVDGVDGDYDQIFYFQSVTSELYSIISLCSGLALDTSGSDLRQASYTGSNHQLFKAIKVNGCFSFVSKAGRAIAVSGSNAKTASYDGKHPASQKFVLTEAPLVIPGVHVLYTASSTKSSATIASDSRSAGVQAKTASYAGSDGQKMLVARSGSGYAVKPVCSGLNLAPSGSSVVQQSKASNWNAKFTTSGARRGVAFVDAGSGKAIQASSGKLVVSSPTLNTSQAFLLAHVSAVSEGIFMVKNVLSGNVLDIANGSWRNGANIQLWSSNGTGAQVFSVKDVGSGLYRMENAMTGYVVAAPSSNVYQTNYKGSYNQLWVPVASPSGGIAWINVASGKALSADGKKAGSNAAAAGNNGSGYQAWSLVKASYSTDYVLRTAMRNAINSWSSTNYQIMVDRDNCRTIVVWWDGSDWKPLYNWTCTPGAPSTPTVGGSYTVGIRGYSFDGALGGDPYTCYYYTQFWGDYLFHSIPYHQGTWNVQDGRLGQKLSHGCVRLATENAKWIYDNIPGSTHVYVYN